MYRCEHVVTRGSAAIKIPRGTSGIEREALRREALALSRLEERKHRRLVHFIEQGVTAEGVPWYAMDCIEGEDLRDFIDRLWGRSAESSMSAAATSALVDVEETIVGNSNRLARTSGCATGSRELPPLLILGARIADALDALHSEGLVHGDLSPRNVLLRGPLEPVLIDFGGSFRVSQHDRSREVAAPLSRRGTAGYVAPELLYGGVVDARSDCYALGCLLYELLTGQRAFNGSSHRYVTADAPSCHRSDIPEALDSLILRLLATEPAERWGRARDVAQRLEQLAGVASVNQVLRGVTPALLFRSRLLEREAQLAAVLRAIDECREGRGGLVLIDGESGVGKTRFVNDVALRATAVGMRVVSAQAAHHVGSGFGNAGVVTFHALLEAVSDSCAEGAAAWLTEMRDAFAALGPYIQHLPMLSNVIPALELLPPELARARVVRSVQEVLCRFARERPLLLIIDDLHWADELTLDVLSDFGRRLRNSPALIVATYRREESTAALRRVTKQDVTELSIERLSLGGIATFSRELLGAERTPEGLPAFVFRHSEGNPFFAAEYLRACLVQGCLRKDGAGDWHFREDSTLPLPRTLGELFELRVSKLSPRGRAALEVASVLGREFERDLFRSLANSEDIAGPGLEELVASEILQWVPSAWYRFVHDKFRETQERALTSSLRCQLHSRAARWLEGSDIKQDLRLSERIGLHWVGAGESLRALPHLEDAARAAARAHAIERAGSLFRLAIEHSLLCQRSRSTAVGSLYEGLGDVLVLSARHEEGRAAYAAAAALLRDERVSLARVHRKHADSCWIVHEYERADESFELAKAALGVPNSDDRLANSEYIALQLSRFEKLYFARRVDEQAREAFHELKPLVDRYAPPAQRCHYYIGCSGLVYASGRYAHCSAAVDFARVAVDLSDESVALNLRAQAKLQLGFALLTGSGQERKEAISWLQVSESDARRAGDATLATRALVYRTLSLLRLGEVAQVSELAEGVLESAVASQLPPYIAAAYAFQGWASWRNNDMARAKAFSERACRTWQSHAHPYPFRWVALVPLIDLYLAEERFVDAGGLLSELVHPSQQVLPADLPHLAESLRRACEAGAVRDIYRLSSSTFAGLRSFAFG